VTFLKLGRVVSPFNFKFNLKSTPTAARNGSDDAIRARDGGEKERKRHENAGNAIGTHEYRELNFARNRDGCDAAWRFGTVGLWCRKEAGVDGWVALPKLPT